MRDTLKKKILVDTNILVYLLDKDSRFNRQVVRFFEWTEANDQRLYIAHQNIIELVRTLLSDYKLKYSTIVDRVKSLLEGSDFQLIFPMSIALTTFFELTKDGVKSGRVFDCYLAATALDNGVDTILTNNQDDYEKIPGLKVLDLVRTEELYEKG